MATPSRTVFLCAALVGMTIAAPITASFADPVTTSPNAINNATIDSAIAPDPLSDIHDNVDKYRDAKGFPQPGWQYF